MEQEDAANGCAALHLVYQLATEPQICALPFKPIKLQPARKAGQIGTPVGSVAYRAYVASKLHIQLFRLTLSLFPKLERLHEELLQSNVKLVVPTQSSTQQTTLEQVRAFPVDQVRYSLPRSYIFVHRCLPYSSNNLLLPSSTEHYI